MGAATHIDFFRQPVGYTSEGVLATQPICRALDASNAVDTTFNGVCTLTPDQITTQFYQPAEKFRTTHTVLAGATTTSLSVTPNLTFDPSLPANYSGIHASFIFKSSTATYASGTKNLASPAQSQYIASSSGSNGITWASALPAVPAAGDTIEIRSTCMFDSQAVNFVNGVATFAGLRLSGHKPTVLAASCPGLTGANSNTLTPTGTYAGRTEKPRVAVSTASPTYDPTVYTLNPANASDASPNFKTLQGAINGLTGAADSAAHRLITVTGGDYTEYDLLNLRTPAGGTITFRWPGKPTAGVRAVPLMNMVGCPRLTTKDNNLGVLGTQAWAVVPTSVADGDGAPIATSTTGGTIGASQTRFYVVSPVYGTIEGGPNNELSITTGAGSTNSITLRWRQPSGPTSYYVYVGTVSGTYTQRFTVAAGGSVATFTDTGAAGTAGSPTTVNVAHDYRFEGWDFQIQTPTNTALEVYQVLAIYDGHGGLTSAAGCPQRIGMDQCSVRGTNMTRIRRGCYIGTTDYFFTNGSVQDIGEDDYGDTHGFTLAGTCVGPVLVRNSYVEAAGENYMCGGGDTAVVGLVTGDVEFDGDHFRKPLSWKWTPSYGIYPQGTSRVIKNLGECKSVIRFWMHGCIFEGSWFDSQDVALVIGSADQTNTSPWQGVRDVLIETSAWRNVSQWATFSGENAGGGNTNSFGAQVIARRITVRNVLVVMNNTYGTAYSHEPGTNAHTIQFAAGVRSFSLTHCTLLADNTPGSSLINADVPVGVDNEFSYNLCSMVGYQIAGSSGGSYGAQFTNYFTAGCTKNVMLDYDLSIGAPYTSYPGDWGHDTKAAVGFVDPSVLFAGIRALTFDQMAQKLALAPGGIYGGTNWTTDGKDVGADMTALRAAIATSFVAGEGTSLDGIEPGATGGSATQLLLSTQPAGAVSGVPMATQPVVRIADSGGSTVTSDTSTVTAAWVSLTGDATASGTLTKSAAAGIATFTNIALTWTVASTGYWTFTDGSLTAANSSTLSLTVAPPPPPPDTGFGITPGAPAQYRMARGKAVFAGFRRLVRAVWHWLTLSASLA